MIRPYFRGIMIRATACETKNVPRRFVSRIRFQSSHVTSMAGLRVAAGIIHEDVDFAVVSVRGFDHPLNTAVVANVQFNRENA